MKYIVPFLLLCLFLCAMERAAEDHLSAWYYDGANKGFAIGWDIGTENGHCVGIELIGQPGLFLDVDCN